MSERFNSKNNHAYGLVTGDIVDLGAYYEQDGVHRFDGPLIRLERDYPSYTLPIDLLKKFMRRYWEANLERGVLIGDEDYTWYENKFHTGDDPIPRVGYKYDYDVPLSKYLPEIEEDRVKERILSDPKCDPLAEV